MRTVRLATIAFVVAAALAASAGISQAALPAPALRVLGIAAPTHLPPTQSEVQRVTVEAEGGTFDLSSVSDGKGTPVVVSGSLTYSAGSPVATIDSMGSGGTVEVGDRIVTAAAGGYPERTIVSCSADCRTPGSTITLSSEFETSAANDPTEVFTKAVAGVTGTFHVGDAIEATIPGTEVPYFAPGTVVTAISGDELVLSAPTDYAYEPAYEKEISFEGLERTSAIAFDAAPAAVQGALEALPAIGGGSVTVVGGPGGEVTNPYVVEFGGSLANRNVPTLSAEGSLTGAHPQVRVSTTMQGGPGTGEIVVLPANVGGAETSGAVTVKIGPLPAGVAFSGPAEGTNWQCEGGAGDEVVSCTTTRRFRSLHGSPFSVHVPVQVSSAGPLEGTAPVEIHGGGSQPDAYQAAIVVSKEPAKFGVAALFAGIFEADGRPYTQAGGHPYEASAYVMVNTATTSTGVVTPVGDPKDITVNLPPGFVGDPLATDRCPQSTLIEPEGGSELCNSKETVGNLDPFIGLLDESLPFESRLYNDVPPVGFAGEFTTRVAIPVQSVLASVDSEEDFGLRLSAPNISVLDKVFGAYTAFEGVPALGNGQALLTTPTNCAETRERGAVVRGTAHSYQEPDGTPTEVVVPQPAVTGCENLQFTAYDPATGKGQVSFSFSPTSSVGSSPVGAIAHLHIAPGGLTDPNGLATPELKRAVIDLPQGLSLNPSAANGLEACSEAQIGYRGSGFPMPNPIRFNEAQPGCPDGSKLATAEIKTPLLENPLVGTVYLAAQEENPFDSLLGVYLVVDDPFTGVLIKLPGNVQADPETGRLRATFEDTPQLPFEDLTLQFRGGGGRSEFSTSEVCGSFPTEGEFTPWSAPESGPPARTSSSFAVSSGCASSPGTRPFAPRFTAGTTGTGAGAFSPFVLKVSRDDGEQELTSLDFNLPAGLIGKLAGIQTCSDQAIAAAAGKSGRAELAQPSCPAGSRLGSVDTAAGVGSEPVHVGGSIYLTGPYRGAPLSAVVIAPAVAGPFDLGDVVVRAPIRVNPETTELSIQSDSIPTILRGIPLKLRSITLIIDRPGFVLNPTNCDVKSISAKLAGGSGAVANAAARFQVGGCSNLKFAPKLKLALKGRTRRGGHPAVTAILTQAPGQANIGKVSVALPRSEFLEQGHIRTNCTRVQFSAEQCPAGSIYGHAEAVTPLLEEPLKGPVYLRSSSHRLPDLVVALKGPPSQPIEIDLDGRIDSIHGGIRTTFEAVPDAPVSRFVLKLPAGKKSLLVNSTNICRGKHKARIEMIGQNGLEHDFSRALEPRCGKRRAGRKHRKPHAHAAEPGR